MTSLGLRMWMGAAVGIALLAGHPGRADAQKGGGDGYLFRAPRGSIALRFGVAKPSENSNVYEDISRQLTINPGDFVGMSGGVDVDYNVHSRVALQASVLVSGREQNSEYRDFVDTDDRPIEQKTSLLRVPLTAGFKAYLIPQGRAVGRFAWVPNKVSAYVGAGGGTVYYAFKQAGDWVDFQDMEVFPSELKSSGWTGTLYGSAGTTVSLSSRVGLVTEWRYDKANANMSSDYQGFERIDLSGMSLTAGLHFRF